MQARMAHACGLGQNLTNQDEAEKVKSTFSHSICSEQIKPIGTDSEYCFPDLIYIIIKVWLQTNQPHFPLPLSMVPPELMFMAHQLLPLLSLAVVHLVYVYPL